MTELQKTLEQELGKLPHQILQNLLEKKLKAAGVNPESALVDRLLRHILSGNTAAFQWDDGNETHSDITVSISEEDIAEVEEIISRLMTSMPDIIENISTNTSKSVLKQLRKEWADEHLLQEKDLYGFRMRLEKRWGKALGMLRMLLTISRELGSEIAKLLPPAKSHLNNVLLRLHVRACQVTAEIITLLENGYADGAMARWRTLHEIGIVMTLINEHGEPLAERYVAHSAVEAKTSKDQYAQCYEQLGYLPITQSECKKIDKAYDLAITKYGKDFQGPYGWAAGYVKKSGKGRIGFGDLEAAAGKAEMASHYKLASYNVHAGPHALFFRLGLWGESGLLAGPSNAGLTEPGQNTAVTFTLTSLLLAKDCINLDVLVGMKMLQQLRDEIPRAFDRAERKLKSDHARHNRVRKAK